MTRAALAALLLAAAPAEAAELFGGLLAHGVSTPLSREIGETGADIQFGIRSAPVLPALGGPRLHALGSVNTRGQTSFAAAGVSWRIGRAVYVRPGIGLAVHDGPGLRVGPDGERSDLGSRVLFNPELSLGVPLGPRVTAEATWSHLSHAQIFSRQNPGLDMVGVRVNLQLH